MMPRFYNSEWFVPEVDNWHLKPGAPPDIVDEFNDWMREREEAERNGKSVD